MDHRVCAVSVLCLRWSFIFLRSNYIVDFEDHLNHLCCQLQLLFLRVYRFEYSLLVHVVCSFAHAVYSKEWVYVSDLFLLQSLNIFNWIITGVFSQYHRNFFQSISECSDCILFNAFNLISFFSNFNSACQFCGSSSTNDIIIFDHISYNTNCIEQTSFSFITNGSWSTSNKNCDCFRVDTILNQKDFVTWSSKCHLLYYTSFAKFLRCYLFKSWDNSSSCGDG